MFKLWKYSIAIFMAILLLWVNFAPKEKVEQVPTIQKTESVKDEDLKVELKDGVVLGKYYTKDKYYIIVWDDDYKRPFEYDVEYNEWLRIHFGEIY